jgi:hypothetical protein
MAEAAHAIPNDRGRAHQGVTFEAWAFVLAGLGDGLPEDDLLAHLGITEERWHLANAAFQEDILDDVEIGGTLTEAFDEAMRAARESWSRPIPPLDTDLRAWLDFFGAWTAAESPVQLLEEHGLRAADIHRLHQHWSGKLAKDEELRSEALAILESPAGPMPAPQPEPPRLRGLSAEGAADVTRPAKVRAVAPMPFTDGEPAPGHPRRAGPVPTRPPIAASARADETRVATPDEIAGVVLPFSASPPESAAPEPAEPSATVADATRDERDGVALSIERYAALCEDLIESPDAHEAVLRRYGVNAAEKLALDVYWTQKMAEDTTIWLAWDRASVQHRAGLSGDGETDSN